mgnify:CR=1 FL=1
MTISYLGFKIYLPSFFIMTKLELFGIKIDTNKNNIRAKKLTEIHTDNSKVKLLVIHTNEEVEIAKQSYVL